MNGDTRPLMVTIQCITYNHEPYIRQCLEGFVMQKTNFRFEAIVHDDASTDGTAAIVREYAEKYPDIIKPIFETENQYSKHDGSLNRIMDEHTHGKYVALCEGDDYWTDKYKLQRQVDYLESHLDCSAISENGIEFNTKSGEQRLFNEEPAHFVSIKEMIAKRRFPTASVMYRKEMIFGDERWKSVRHKYDTMLWCFLASKGNFYYNAIISSVYRRGPGVTVSTDPYQFARICEEWYRELQENFPQSLSINEMKRIMVRSYINAANRYIKQRSFSKKIHMCYKRGFILSPWLFIYQIPILYYAKFKRLLL